MKMDNGSGASRDAEKNNEELRASHSENSEETTGSNYGDPEAAKQERQQDNGKKKSVCVECDGENYRVKNEGDESYLYESQDKEATLDFARKLAEEHNVDMIVDDRVNEDRSGDDRKERMDDSSGEESREGQKFREDRGENEGPRNILVEEEGRYYVVRNEGDHAKLYESTDKEATIEFARKVAESHGIDLLVIDRDKRVVTEEKYSNGLGQEEDKQTEE